MSKQTQIILKGQPGSFINRQGRNADRWKQEDTYKSICFQSLRDDKPKGKIVIDIDFKFSQSWLAKRVYKSASIFDLSKYIGFLAQDSQYFKESSVVEINCKKSITELHDEHTLITITQVD